MLRERWHFETDCIHSDGPSINALLESATDISYATAYKILGPVLTQRAAELGYGGRGGLKLKDDWHVSYHRGVYRCRPAVFFRWSAIEQIFLRDRDGARRRV